MIALDAVSRFSCSKWPLANNHESASSRLGRIPYRLVQWHQPLGMQVGASPARQKSRPRQAAGGAQLFSFNFPSSSIRGIVSTISEREGRLVPTQEASSLWAWKDQAVPAARQ